MLIKLKLNNGLRNTFCKSFCNLIFKKIYEWLPPNFSKPIDQFRLNHRIPMLKFDPSMQEIEHHANHPGFALKEILSMKNMSQHELAVRAYLNKTTGNSLVSIMPDQRKNNENFFSDFFGCLTATIQSCDKYPVPQCPTKCQTPE